MLRTALKPRWAGLFLLVVAIVALFWRLGLWQLHVANHVGEQSSVAVPASQPLTKVLVPHGTWSNATLGQPVTMTGSYAEGQVLVADRRLVGVVGYWVVAPFVVTDGGATTGTIALVRGFVTDPTAAPEPPPGTMAVAGALAPGESPTDGARPAGQLGSLDLSVLVNTWTGDLYNAFAFVTAETPEPALGVMKRVPPPDYSQPKPIEWRNAAYAFQWWAFALFAVFLWFKMVRDDWLVESGRRVPPTAPVRVGENGPRET